LLSLLSSRSKDIVEPIVKAQWYVRCSEMAKRALNAVESGNLKIIPESHVKTWNNWLGEIKYFVLKVANEIKHIFFFLKGIGAFHANFGGAIKYRHILSP
jgi:hypothetical protein